MASYKQRLTKNGWPMNIPYIANGSPSGRPEALPPQWRLSYRAEVQFADLDKNMHVSNTVAARWFQEARFRFKPAFLLPLVDESELHVGQVVRKATVLYDRQVLIGDTVEVYMCVSHIGASSWTYAYRVWSVHTRQWVLSGDTVMVYFDHHKQEKAPLGPSLRRALESCMAVKASL